MSLSIKRSIRTKIMALISIAMIGLLTFLFIISTMENSASFDKLERSDSLDRVGILENAVQNEIHNIYAPTRDYATWNDSYLFMNDRNQSYVNVNLIPETFRNLEMSFIILVGTNGDVAFGKEYNRTTETLDPLQPGMMAHLSLDGPILSGCIAGNETMGLIMVDGRAVLFAARPILTSEVQGPSEGALLMGRVMDEALIGEFENTTGLPLKLFDVSDLHLRAELGIVAWNELINNQRTIHALNESTIAGYTLAKDIYGDPSVILQISIVRDIHAQGVTSLQNLAILLTIASLAFGIVTFLLLERTVVSRLSNLRHEVSRLDPNSKDELHVNPQGEDEIGGLANSINAMLATIDGAQKELTESEKRYRLLVDSAAEAIVVAQDGMLRLVNPMAVAVTGFSEKELLSKPFPSLIHPDDRAMVVDRYQRRSRGEDIPSRYAFRLLSKDGSTKWVEISAVPIDWEGRPATLNFLTDITDRKRVEEALNESVQRYELVMDGSSAGLWDWNVPDKRVHFSSRWKAMRGYADAEIGDSETEWSSRVHPDDAPRVMAALQAHFEGRTQVYEEEYRILCKDGSIKWILDRGKAVRDATGQVIRAAGSEIDITDRKRVEKALVESEAMYRLLADNSTDVIGIMDQKGAYTYVSPSVFQLRGYTPEEVLHQTIDQILTKESISIVQDAIHQNLEKVKQGIIPPTLVIEEEQLCKDGSTVWVEAITNELFDAARSHIGSIVVCRDISKRRRAEDALRLANAKLGILSNVTRHDINNQMMVLSGFLELCRQREKDPGLAPYFDKMSRAATNVQEQIAFTKSYQELGIHAPAWASIGRRVADAFALLHPQGVTLEEGTGGIEVLTDPLADKVHYNLIDNSMRHGGHVTRIKISSEQVGDSMKIIYEDNGVGISAEDKKHLFEKGYGKNTGYGLFLIREILAITGIKITEKGQAGKGVRFEMLVPPGAWRRPSA